MSEYEVKPGSACRHVSMRRCFRWRVFPYLHLAVRAAGGVVGVGEFEQFDGRAVFDYERDADAVGWAVGRNQDFAASKLGGEISHFKGDVRNLADEIGDRRVGFETHPLDAEFAFLVADDEEFQVFQVGLARLRFRCGNSDVMVAAHGLSLPVELAQILRCRCRVGNRAGPETAPALKPRRSLTRSLTRSSTCDESSIEVSHVSESRQGAPGEVRVIEAIWRSSPLLRASCRRG